MSAHDFAIFDSIVAACLPAGQGAVVALSHVYFDESGTHEGSRIMAMAGYWFDADQARKFSRDWSKDLAKMGLRAAHMTDCALGYGEYKGMTKEQRIESEKLLIAHIKRRSKFSVATCLNPSMYAEVFANVPGAPSAYSFLLMNSVNAIAQQARFNNYDGRIAYFFEAGHRHANESNKYMTFMALNNDKGFFPEYRYSAHAFVDKRISLPLQAADMLVWQTRHYFERAMDGHETLRKDFKSLIRIQDTHALVGRDHLLALAELYKHPTQVILESLTGEVGLAHSIMRAHGLNPYEAEMTAALLAQAKRQRHRQRR